MMSASITNVKMGSCTITPSEDGTPSQGCIISDVRPMTGRDHWNMLVNDITRHFEWSDRQTALSKKRAEHYRLWFERREHKKTIAQKALDE